GTAAFTYQGTKLGSDTATASLTQGATSLQSNTATITWIKATPQISTTPSGPITIGGSITDTAAVTKGFTPTGPVYWNVYSTGDTTCHTPLNAAPLTASLANGSATSPPFTPAAPGTYQFVASYPGDANNQPAAGRCGDTSEQVSVIKA